MEHQFKCTAEELLMEYTINNFPDKAFGYCYKYGHKNHFIAEDLQFGSNTNGEYAMDYKLTYKSHILEKEVEWFYSTTFPKHKDIVHLDGKLLSDDEILQIGDKPLLHVFNGISVKSAR